MRVAMMTYRSSRLMACALLVAPGLVVSLTWPTGSVLALFAACALMTATARIQLNLVRVEGAARPPLRSVTEGVAGCAVLGGTVVVALVGLSTLVGAWVLLVCLLVAGSSPGAVRFYRRRVAGVDASTDHRPPADDLPPAEHSLTAVEREARGLTDTDLCQVWRTSFRELRAATSPSLQAEIVASRQVYLDELARRDRAGLEAWMSSGAAGPEDASPVFSTSTRRSETSIDWDAMVFDQEDP